MNHVGSSKNMDTNVAIFMAVQDCLIFKGGVYITFIISDDGCRMQSKISHGDNNMHRKLQLDIHYPTFQADPLHRINNMAKYVYALSKLPKSLSYWSNLDAT